MNDLIQHLELSSIEPLHAIWLLARVYQSFLVCSRAYEQGKTEAIS